MTVPNGCPIVIQIEIVRAIHCNGVMTPKRQGVVGHPSSNWSVWESLHQLSRHARYHRVVACRRIVLVEKITVGATEVEVAGTIQRQGIRKTQVVILSSFTIVPLELVQLPPETPEIVCQQPAAV